MGDRQCSQQDVCHLFNNVHPDRNPIVQLGIRNFGHNFSVTSKNCDVNHSLLST
jgi:hypothetical protein